MKSFPNHHYVANVCWRLTFSLSIRHLNSKEKLLVLILANSTLRPSQSINQGSSKIEKRVLLVNFYNYIFYCYTQNKTFLHSTLWECSSGMRDVTSTKTTSFLDESNIVTEIWNLYILGIYIYTPVTFALKQENTKARFHCLRFWLLMWNHYIPVVIISQET